MTRVKHVECDSCGDTISPSTTKLWARLKRPFWLRLRRYYGGVGRFDNEGWAKVRIDLCEDCWNEVLDTLKDKVSGDG